MRLSHGSRHSSPTTFEQRIPIFGQGFNLSHLAKNKDLRGGRGFELDQSRGHVIICSNTWACQLLAAQFSFARAFALYRTNHRSTVRGTRISPFFEYAFDQVYTKMPLCPDCTSSSLSAPLQVVKSSDILGSRSRTKTSNEHSIQQLNLSSLRQSATNCDLCALFLKLVEFQDALLPEIDPVEVQCHIYLKDYGDILSQEPGSTIDPEENLVLWFKGC